MSIAIKTGQPDVAEFASAKRSPDDLSAGSILARLDRLPATRHIWTLVILLSLGGMFEFYDIAMTAYVVPGMVRGGLLTGVTVGIFSGPALFVAALFVGLFIGTAVFGFIADRYGRRAIFTYSMVAYSAATLVMCFQTTGLGLCLWRMIAGIGIGVEIVTIDAYIAEIVPKAMRGRAFVVNLAIQFTAVPLVALLAFLLVPQAPLGWDGWRWVALIGCVGALIVWVLRRTLPESPRWLINHGQLARADAVTTAIEARVQADLGSVALPSVGAHSTENLSAPGSFAEIWREPYRRRTIMLVIFQAFQAVGVYGFNAWVPTIIAQQTGINIGMSLQYALIIAIAQPFGPIIAWGFADRIERKWQIVGAALSIAVFGMLFSLQQTVVLLIVFGMMITLSQNLMAYAFHSYMTELFPTRVRARAVGFTYAFSRLGVVFGSFIIAFFFAHFDGTVGVFGFIAASMLIAILAIAVLGPRTRNLELEEISH